MTTVTFGSTGTLTKRDDWGGFSDVGGAEPDVWATDDGDTSYLRWTTPNLAAPPPSTDSRLDWTPPSLAAKSIVLRLRAKHPAGGAITALLAAEVWRNDLSDLRGFTGMPNFVGSGYETIASDPLTDLTALGWLATGTGFLRLIFASFAGAVGLASGDETRYTQIALDYTPAMLPPLRQFPRDDGLTASGPRRQVPRPTSLQASARQRPAGYL